MNAQRPDFCGAPCRRITPASSIISTIPTQPRVNTADRVCVPSAHIFRPVSACPLRSPICDHASVQSAVIKSDSGRRNICKTLPRLPLAFIRLPSAVAARHDDAPACMRLSLRAARPIYRPGANVSLRGHVRYQPCVNASLRGPGSRSLRSRRGITLAIRSDTYFRTDGRYLTALMIALPARITQNRISLYSPRPRGIRDEIWRLVGIWYVRTLGFCQKVADFIERWSRAEQTG